MGNDGINDLNLAAARRLNRELAKVELTVFALYHQQIASAITMLLPRLGAEKTWSLVDAAMTMVFTDTKAYEASGGQGMPSGGPHTLYLPFVTTHFGGDGGLAFHVCRVLLFSLAGICVPEHEEVIRSGMRQQFENLLDQLALR